jgi:fibronectin-binding autotransporter adhesin
MADRYWVGGTGTWNTTSTSVWSTSSGGAGGASVPTAADNVIFDQASTYTVTMTGALNCLDFTVSAGSPTFAVGTGPSLTIAGSLTLNTTTTWNLSSVGIYFTSTTAQTINTNGRTLTNSIVEFMGAGGTWTLQGNMSTHVVNLTQGTLNLNSYQLSLSSYFQAGGSSPRTLDFGSSGSVRLTGSLGVTIWNTSSTTNFSVAGTPLVITATSGTGTKTIHTGTLAEANTASFQLSDTGGTIAFTSGNTIKNLDVNAGSYTLSNVPITIYGNYSFNGVSTPSYTAGTNAWTFAATSGTKTIFGGGRTHDFPITINGVGGTFQLTDTLGMGTGKAFTLTNGTFDQNGKGIIGSPTVAGGSVILRNVTDNITQNSGTATLDNNTSIGQYTLNGGTLSLSSYTLTVAVFSSTGTTARTLDFGTGKIVLSLSSTATSWNTGTPTNLTVTGTNPLVECIGGGTGVTKTINTGAMSEANAISFSFLETTGTATHAFTAGNSVKNLIFNGAQTISNIAINIFGNVTHQTTNGTTTFTAGTNAWTFAATSGSYTLGYISGFTYNFPWTFGSAASTATWTLPSNLTLGATRQLTLTNGTVDFNSKTVSAGGITILTGTPTIANTGTGSFTTSLPITHTSGNLTLPFDITTTSASGYTFTAGNLSLGSFTLTTRLFNAGNVGTKTLDFGTGKILLNGSVTATIWSNDATMTVSGTSLVECTGGGTAVTKTINVPSGTSETNAINFSIIDTGGTPSYTFSNNCGFKNLIINGSQTINNSNIRVFGNFTHSTTNGTTTFVAGANTCTFSATSGNYNISNINGFTYDFPITFGSASSTATWTLANNLTLGATRQLTLTNGTTDFNSKSLSSAGITIVTGTPSIANTGTNSFTTSLPITHTSGSFTLPFNVTTTSTSGYTLTAGTLALGSNTLTTRAFISNNSNARTLNFGTGNIILNPSTALTIWNTATVTNMTVSGTPLVITQGSGAVTKTISAGALSVANSISFQLNDTAGTIAFTASNTVRNLTVNGTFTLSNIAITIYGNYTYTAGTLTAGTNAWTFGATSGAISLNFGAGPTTHDFPITIGSAAGAATFTLATNLPIASRRLTLQGGTFDQNGKTITATDILTNFGTVIVNNLNVSQAIITTGGTLTLGSAATTGAFSLDSSGSLSLNSFTLTTPSFTSTGASSKTLNFGTGQLALTGSNATILSLNNLVNTTGNVYINSTYTGATGTRTFSLTSMTEAQAAGYDVKTSGTTGIVFGTTATDTVAFTGTFNNFDLTGLTNTLSNTARTLYGNFTVPASGGTLTAGTSVTTFAGAGTETITTNGRTIDFPINFNGTGTFQLGGNLALGSIRDITLTTGTIDLNDFTATCQQFSSSTTGVRSINFRTSGQLTISGGNGATAWNTATATNFTWTGTLRIFCSYTGSGPSGRTFNFGTLTETYAFNIKFAATAQADAFTITTSTDSIAIGGDVKDFDFTNSTNSLANSLRNVYGNFTLPASGGTLTSGTNATTFLGSSGTRTITTNGRSFTFPLTLNGAGRTWQIADATTTTSTLTITAGTLDLNNLTFTAANFNSDSSGVRSILFGTTGQITLTTNNLNIWNTTTVTNFTWTGTHRIFASYTGATGTRSLIFGTLTETYAFNIKFAATAQANAFTFATSTDIVSIAGDINDFDFTNSTNVLANVARNVYGNFTVPASGGTLNSGTIATTFLGSSGTRTITTNGRTIPFPFVFGQAGRTWQLAGALTTTQALTHSIGVLDLNNFTITATTFSSTGTSVRSVAFGTTGQLTLTGNAATVVDISNATNFSYTGTPKIYSSYTGATGTRTFNIGGTAGHTTLNIFDVSIGTSGTGIFIAGATDTIALTGFFNNVNLTGLTHILSNTVRTIYGNFTVPASGGTLTAGTSATTLAATSAVDANGHSAIFFNNAQMTTPVGSFANLNSGDFTVEAWIWPQSLATDNYLVTVGTGGSVIVWGIFVGTTGLLYFGRGTGAWGWSNYYASTSRISLTKWTHVAFVVSSGNTLDIYIDGVKDATHTIVRPVTPSGTFFLGTYFNNHNNVGDFFKGYVSNFRIINGTGIYTDNTFTVPTSSLTPVANTSLLTIQDFNITKDNSANNVSLTATNNPRVSYVSPFESSTNTSLLTTSNRLLDFPITIGNDIFGTGSVQLSSNLTSGSTRTLTLISGTLSLNNFVISTGLLNSNGSNTRNLNFSTNGEIRIVSNNATILDFTTANNFTYSGTPRIYSTTNGTAAQTRTFNFGGTSGATPNNVFDVSFGTTGTGLVLAPGVDIVALTGQYRDFNLTNITNTLSNTIRYIHGNTAIPAVGGTLTAGASDTFFSPPPDTTITINTNARTLDFPIRINGAGTAQLQANLIMGSLRPFTMDRGTIDLNGRIVSANSFNSNTTNNRSIIFGTSGNGAIALGNSTTIWNTTTGTNFTWTGNFRVDSTAGATGTRTINFGTIAEEYAPNVKVTLGTAGFNLGTATSTVALSGNVGGLDLTGFAGTLTNLARNVHGNLTFPASGGTFTAGATATSLTATSGEKIITYNSRAIDFPIIINGTGGTFIANGNVVSTTSRTLTLTNGHFDANSANIIASGITVLTGNASVSNLNTTLVVTHTSGTLNLNSNVATGTYTLTAGTLNPNTYNLTCRTFSSSGSGNRTINFGTGNIVLSNTGGQVWSTATVTNLTTTNDGGGVIIPYSGSLPTDINPGALNEANSINFSFNSGTYALGIQGSSTIRSLDLTGFNGTTSFGTNINIYKDLKLSTGLTIQTGSFGFIFAGNSTSNVTSSGKTFSASGGSQTASLTVNKTGGGSLVLMDNLTHDENGAAFTLTSGTINLNNYLLTTNTFSSSNSNERSIDFLDTGKIRLTCDTTATMWDMSTPTNFTYSGNSIIETIGTGSGVAVKTINTGVVNETQALNWSLKDTMSSGGIVRFTSGNAVKNLTIDGAFTLSNIPITIYGNYTYLNATALTSGTNAWTFDGLTNTFINGGAATHNFPWIFNKTSTANLALQSATTIGSTTKTSFNRGTFDLNGYNYTTGIFDIGYSSSVALPNSVQFVGRYLRTDDPTNTIFSPHTGVNFTIEFWFYYSGGSFNDIIGYRTGADSSVYLVDISSGKVRFVTAAAYGNLTITSNSTLSTNTWYHVAVVREGTGTDQTKLYVNGQLEGVGTLNDTTTPGVNARFYVGASAFDPFNGFISNFRFVREVAVYTSEFVVPAIPLTAITGTQLLVCATDNPLQDKSPYQRSIVYEGSSTYALPAVSNNTPFLYNSVYFDGTGDYLSVPANTALAFGTGDFTIECWFYRTSTGTTLLSNNPATNTDNNYYTLDAVSANATFQIRDNTSQAFAYGPAITTNKWTHVAVTRSSGTVRVFVNGVSGTPVTITKSITSRTTIIGGFLYTGFEGYFSGYISNLRLIKGTALYTADFRPEPVPLTNIANTSLLTCQSTNFSDNSNNNFTITSSGNAVVDVDNPFLKSVYFDGTGDYLSLTGQNLNATNWTIECWVYFNNFTNNTPHIFNFGTDINNRYVLFRDSDGKFRLTTLNAATGNPAIGTTTVLTNIWYHVAVVRNSSTGVATLYVNGIAEATSTNASISSGTNWVIGWQQFSGLARDYINGYISNFRITKSLLYTSNFTVPTNPLTAIANTSLLTCTSPLIRDYSNNDFTITAVGNSVVDDKTPISYGSTVQDKTLQFSNGGTITITGTGSNTFNNQVTDGIPIQVSNGNASISMTSSSAKTFAGNSVNYSPIILNQGGTGTLIVTGNNTFGDLSASISSTANSTISFTSNTTTTFNTFTITGTATYKPTMNATTIRSRAYIAANANTNGIYNTGADYIQCRDIAFTPFSVDGSDYVRWFVGANSVSLDNNRGALFQNYDANNFNKVYVIERLNANTWTIPEDFDVGNNTIHIFGGGGAGGYSDLGRGGGGGGGGGYTRITNFYGFKNQNLIIQIGSGGSGSTSSNGSNTVLSSWYGNYFAEGGRGAGNGAANTLPGGFGGRGLTANGGSGGRSVYSTGSVVNSGGAGGGGAGGPSGNGGSGGNGSLGSADGGSAGGGGGGNGGGTTGSNAVGTGGGSGGNNALGFGGGIGSTGTPVLSFSGGGGAGAGRDSTSSGGTGSMGVEILNSFGSAGGSGGTPGITGSGFIGGLGVFPGGGGGGAGVRSLGTNAGGNGGPGGVFIVYKPGTAPVNTGNNFLMMF